MLNITADLAFAATAVRQTARPAFGRWRRTRLGEEKIEGHVRAAGRIITVQLSRLPSLAPLLAPGTGAAMRTAADRLTSQGLTVLIIGPADQVIAEIGEGVRSPAWQRPLTRSRSIRIKSWRDCLRSLNGPRLLRAAFPKNRLPTR